VTAEKTAKVQTLNDSDQAFRTIEEQVSALEVSDREELAARERGIE
jgi:hypothetical protein